MTESHAPRKPLRVLFVCIENAARSQIVEALFDRLQRAAIEQRIAAINRADASDGAAG
jgi:protein-tyrosine-phosphatase